MYNNKILLLIPAYNEELNIKNTLYNLKEANVTDIMDVLVINDGSADNTEKAIKECGFDVLSQVYNLGYGAALQTGYKYATEKNYDFVLQMDADGQHDVRNLDRLLKKIIPKPNDDSTPDIVIGTRFLEGSETFYVSKLKMVAIKFFRFIIKDITGSKITDPTSGLMALNRNAFSYYSRYLNFDTKYPDLNMTMQMLLLGFKIGEIPAIMHARTQGESMHDGLFNVGRYMFIMMLSTFNAYIRHRTTGRRKKLEKK